MKTFFLSLLCLPLLMFGQEQFAVQKTVTYPFFMGQTNQFYNANNEICIVKINKDDINLLKINGETNEIILNEMLPPLEKGARVERILEFNQNYYIFYNFWNKKAVTEELFYVAIDFETGQLSEKKSLVKVEEKIRWQGLDKFTIQVSEDLKTLMVQYKHISPVKNNRKSYEQMEMLMFDSNLSKVFSKTYTLPGVESEIYKSDYLVDNKGNNFTKTDLYVKKRTYMPYVNEKKNFKTELIIRNANLIDSVKYQKDDLYINNIWFKSTVKDVYAAGLYAFEDNKRKHIKGVLLSKVVDNKLEQIRTYDIPEELISQYKSVMGKEAGTHNLKDLNIDKIHLQEDGSFLLIGEQASYNAVGSTVVQYKLNLLVMKIAANGELEWARLLPKSQRGTRISARSVGYKYKKYNNKHYFFYMDSPDNMTKGFNEKPEPYVSSIGGVLAAYCISDDGSNLTREVILDLRDQDEPWVPMDKFSPTDKGFFVEHKLNKKQNILLNIEIK